MSTGQSGGSSSAEIPTSQVLQFVSSCQKVTSVDTLSKYLRFIPKVKESF